MTNEENKEITRVSHDNIAQQYYDEYHNDKTDLSYFDDFMINCNSKILDLGCGMGHYSKYMKSKGFDVIGIDFSEGMINIARRTNPDIEFIEADICNLPKSLDDDFDGVVLAFVLQHMSKEDAKKCLNGLHQHLKEKAQLLILFRFGDKVVIEPEPFNSDFAYLIKEYTINELSQLLSECGYKVKKITRKPYINDPNSLVLTTAVIFAEKS